MNKIVRIAALAAVVGTAILSYSLPQAKTASGSNSIMPIPAPGVPQTGK